MKKVGDLLETILKEVSNGDGYLIFLISQKFKEHFSELGPFSKPCAIRDGIVYISVQHSVGLNFLQFKKEEILDILQKEFSKEEIKEIKLILKKE